MPELSRVEIDLRRLDANVQAIRQLLSAGRAKLCAVVKKNGYGLGALPIAHKLVKAGCDMLAVYEPDEAEELVRGSITCPILIFAQVNELSRTDALYRHAVADKLHLTVHEPAQLKALNATGRTFGMRMAAHLYVDTGMSRAGLNGAQLAEALEMLGRLTHVRLAGVYSHFATADNDPAFCRKQYERFRHLTEKHRDALPQDAVLHLANSFGLLRDARYHLDMVRIGLSLHGFGPEMLKPGPTVDAMPTYQPTVRWTSRVVHVQHYPANTPVGYGSTHKLKRASVLGVVPVGYGDGYPLALGNKATVRVRSDAMRRKHLDAKVLGKVNMDQITIDLTGALGKTADPRKLLDAEVDVYSNDPSAPNAIAKLAKMIQSHPYELLCRLSPLLPRVYVNGVG